MVPYAISNFANNGCIVFFSEDAENWKLSGGGRIKGRSPAHSQALSFLQSFVIPALQLLVIRHNNVQRSELLQGH